MKKAFLAIVLGLSLSGVSFAQDDEYEEVVYEEEEAPAPKPKKQKVVYEEVEEDEDEAPAPKKEKKKAKKASTGAVFGIGLDLMGMLSNDQAIRGAFKLNDDMELSFLLGLWHRGETTWTIAGVDVDGNDDATSFSIGAGFDYFLLRDFLPFSLGGEIVFNRWNENASRLDFNILAGLHAEVAPNLVLSGKTGISIKYNFGEEGGNDYGRIDFGLAYRIYLTWYAF